MTLTFEPVTHAYAVDGIVRPSVGTVIKFAGIGHQDTADGYEIPEDVMDAARERGSLIHEACHFLDEGDLDWDSLDDDVAAGVEAWQQFLDCEGFVSDLIERPLYCEKDDYCGTPDRIGWIGDDRCVVDIKTSTVGVKPWHALQLAAYANADLGPPIRRLVVELKPWQKRKKYHVCEFPLADYEWDLSVFLAARKLYAWKELHGK